MIHTATQTLKFKRLVRRVRALLGAVPIDPETICVGILERLWHTAITSAIRGDIGRLENEEIAEAVGWHGDADQIIQILIDTEWLDECSENRLLVHDWDQHAPKHVKGNVTKVGGFAFKALPLRPRPNVQPLEDKPLTGGASNLTKPNVTKQNQSEAAPQPSRPSKKLFDSLPIPPELDNPDARAALDRWETHRKQIKKPLTQEQALAQLKQLAIRGSPAAIAMIDHTIFKGWQGLREDDSSGHSNGKQASGYKVHEP